MPKNAKNAENAAPDASIELSGDAAPQTSSENASAAVSSVTTFADLAAAAPNRPDDLMVADPLSHNGVFYAPGARVDASLFTGEQLALLKKEGVLKFRHEMEAPEEIAKEYAELQSDIERYKAEILRLGGSVE